jgi:dipeptidyl aminopeptidase/acylaminoacyl peptidase
MLPYQSPPEIVASVVEAPSQPQYSIGPRKVWAIRTVAAQLPNIESVAAPELGLAGLRINPVTGGSARVSFWGDLALFHVESGHERAITGLPDDARIRRLAWSPNGFFVALGLAEPAGMALWLLDVRKAHAAQLVGPRLVELIDSPFTWEPDSSGLIARLAPARRGAPPPAPKVPVGPVIQESFGKTRPARTYRDLLQSEHDEAVFEHFLTCRLARITLAGKTRSFGPTGLILRASPSPDGRYVLMDELLRPFSYQVGQSRFPRRTSVLDRRGNVVRVVADLPLAESIPVAHGSTREGPRGIHWRPDAPAQLAWAEALDGGDGARTVDHRDRVFLHDAPFDDPPRRWLDTELRYGGVYWGGDDLNLVTSSWYRTRRLKVMKAAVDSDETTVVWDRNWEDRYTDPGVPLTTRNAAGRSVLRRVGNGSSLLLAGAGASPSGNEPFLDRFNLDTGETTRIWQSKPPMYEQLVAVMDPEARRLLLARESETTPPALSLLRAGAPEPFYHLTKGVDPTPQYRGIRKEIIEYTRDDGVPLTGTLYRPAEGDGPWPTVFWAYPREYKTAGASGQVRDSPHRFLRLTHWTPFLWCAMGYAVLADPSMPIIGEGETEPNDTYVDQLVRGAEAAVKTLVDRGVSERGRFAVGGHSYGAFMTLNLLAHCDLFATGIARSGAYNRTLTPFGFQAEERTLWDAQEVYTAMSPLLQARNITAPVLLIHGDADSNSGTWKMQSERMYGALKGLGKDARLVLLPHEGHAYRASESVLHMLWETERWLGRYLPT